MADTFPFSTQFYYRNGVCTECKHDGAAHVKQEDNTYICSAMINRYEGAHSWSAGSPTRYSAGYPDGSSPGTLVYTYPCQCIREADE